MNSIEIGKEIRIAIRQGDVDRVKTLIGLDQTQLDMMCHFGTWLHYAAKSGQLEIVKCLVNSGADINTRGGMSDGGAINEAAANGHLEVVKYLLSCGAEMDVSDSVRNPLFSAIYGGHVAIAKLLIDNGIDVRPKNARNMDAQAFALERGQMEIAAFLGASLPAGGESDPDLPSDGVSESPFGVVSDEMLVNLAGLVKKLKLEKHLDFICKIAQPSIELVATRSKIAIGGSKFGGSPDLPKTFQWPKHKLGPYRFIGQINISELPKGIHGFPGKGLISFFYAYDEAGETFWGDPDFIRVFRFEELDEIQPVQPPESVRLDSGCKIEFKIGADVPSWPWDAVKKKKWPIDESQEDAYSELRGRLHPSGKYLLGFPFNTTLAYDPTPGPEWCSLLTLDSDDEMNWCWHDGDWLVTFIEKEKIRNGDFFTIKADAG